MRGLGAERGSWVNTESAVFEMGSRPQQVGSALKDAH